jgi:hypothetical protein
MRKIGLLAAAIAAAVLAAFALAACDGDNASSEDEDQISKAVEFAAVSGDPAACTQAQTQAFTEQITGQSGQAALRQCERDAKDVPADSVDVENIEVDGDSASAEAAFSGGFFGGQTIALDLVKEGDSWKLDKATGFEDFDRDAFVAAFKQELAQEEDAPAGAADCVAANVQKLSDDQIEDLFLNSNSQLEDQVFSPCFEGQG